MGKKKGRGRRKRARARRRAEAQRAAAKATEARVEAAPVIDAQPAPVVVAPEPAPAPEPEPVVVAPTPEPAPAAAPEPAPAVDVAIEIPVDEPASEAASPPPTGSRPQPRQAAAAAPKRRKNQRRTREVRRPPRYGFWKGAFLGAVFVIPSVGLAVFLLSQLGIGDAAGTLSRALEAAVVFAGIPAVLTAGGVGRLAARAVIAPDKGSVGRAVSAGAVTFSVAGAGLVLLAAIPLGHLPEEPLRWMWVGAAGLIAGAASGAVIGLWAGTGRLPE